MIVFINYKKVRKIFIRTKMILPISYVPVCMSANGNTFLMMNCTNSKFKYLKMLFWFVAKKVDSCIVFWIDNNNQTDSLFVKMEIYFPKGGFCGNGARALAKFLHDKLKITKRCTIITPTENVNLHKDNIFYGMACKFPIIKKITVFCDGDNSYIFWCLSVVNENHMITFENISEECLSNIGTKFSEKMMSNFSKCIIDVDTIYLKTFERGIQKFTKSCGTATICTSYLIHFMHTKCFTFSNNFNKLTITTDGGKLYTIIDMVKKTISLKGNCYFI